MQTLNSQGLSQMSHVDGREADYNAECIALGKEAQIRPGDKKEERKPGIPYTITQSISLGRVGSPNPLGVPRFVVS